MKSLILIGRQIPGYYGEAPILRGGAVSDAPSKKSYEDGRIFFRSKAAQAACKNWFMTVWLSSSELR
jgi:hypothetical protein